MPAGARMTPEARGLSPEALASARALLDEESVAREHVVVALSGAHAYGFPSPDSDVDLKAAHVAPTRDLVGLSERAASRQRMEVRDGVELDYTTNEIGMVLRGALKGDGNFIERLVSGHAIVSGPEHEALRPLIARSLSRRLRRHYEGFATAQMKQAEGTREPRVKNVLYVFRTALTGVHALLRAEIVTDVNILLLEHGFGDAVELVARKRAGEAVLLTHPEGERWIPRAREAIDRIGEAAERSVLPEEAPNLPEIEAWLLELRRSRW